ncbi:MAG: twin-arginine translocation signal domain-containing protein [Sedimenticola sp.]|nr:twin-arginine translocation signal domain-containing protein [Sedimenticola sp.]
MKEDKKQMPVNGRRKFLRGSLMTGMGVAAAATIPGTVLASESDPSVTKEEQKGYHLTKHILDYYKTMAS